MGRLLRRVPLDFDHKLGVEWPGFNRQCEAAVQGECDTEGCEGCRDAEPPEGPGYQLWETVSAGSPISPVFADSESFVGYLIEDQDCHRDSAVNFLREGWAPSLAFVNGLMFKGIELCGVGVHLRPGTRVRHRDHGTLGTAIDLEAPAGLAGVEWETPPPSMTHADGGPLKDSVKDGPVKGFSSYENLEILDPDVTFCPEGIRAAGSTEGTSGN